MLDIPGTWVARDSEEVTEVMASNTKYKEVKKETSKTFYYWISVCCVCVCVCVCVHVSVWYCSPQLCADLSLSKHVLVMIGLSHERCRQSTMHPKPRTYKPWLWWKRSQFYSIPVLYVISYCTLLLTLLDKILGIVNKYCQGKNCCCTDMSDHWTWSDISLVILIMYIQEVGVLATTWDMYDTYQSISKVKEEESEGWILHPSFVQLIWNDFCKQMI